MGAIGLLIVVRPVVAMILRLVVSSTIRWLMVVSGIGHRLVVVTVARFWPLVVMVVRSQGSGSSSKASNSWLSFFYLSA